MNSISRHARPGAEHKVEFSHRFFSEADKVWTDPDIVPGVRDQLQCNSCNPQAGTDAICSGCAIEDKQPFVKLSTQGFIDCGEHNNRTNNKPDKKGCKTSTFKELYEHGQNYGFYEEQTYGPYKNKKEDCRTPKGRRLKIGGYRIASPSEATEVILEQPVTAKIAITPEFKDHLGEDVYVPIEVKPTGQKQDNTGEKAKVFFHAVLVIGYGVTKDERKLEYFIIKNSWGPDWGFFGYARVLRSSLSMFTYPVGPYVFV